MGLLSYHSGPCERQRSASCGSPGLLRCPTDSANCCLLRWTEWDCADTVIDLVSFCHLFQGAAQGCCGCLTDSKSCRLLLQECADKVRYRRIHYSPLQMMRSSDIFVNENENENYWLSLTRTRTKKNEISRTRTE
jgi:hypothetical protein